MNWVNAIVLLYLLLVLGIGIWTGRNIKNLSDYAVAGRSFGAMVIFFTLAASFIGGGFSMGNAERVFVVGIANVVALWGFSFKELWVARYVAPKMGKYADAISVGDIMAHHYGTIAKVFSGLFGFIVCAGILGAQIGATGYIVNVFLGIDRVWGIVVGCGIVITYATLGGMRAVVWTDVVQFLVLAIGIPLALIYGVMEAGGISAIIEAVPADHFRLPSEPLALVALASLFLTFVLGETLVPPYLQRLLIGKDPDHIARGTLYSGLFSIPFFAITGMIGLVALTLNPDLNPNLAMPYVIQQSMPPILQGLVVAAVLAIIMSSADSFLNAASICFMNDVLKPLTPATESPAMNLRLARLVTLIVGVLAVVFALSIESVLDILIYSYNFWAPLILVPLVAAIMGYRATPMRFVYGAGAGVFGVLLWSYILDKPFGVDGLIIGVLANAITFFAVDRGSVREPQVEGEQEGPRISSSVSE